MAKFPARIHILLARHQPLGLVIRRGPSKKVCTLLWHRHTDEFSLGQWFNGRIYERRSDLSPNGKYFIYFAMNGQWRSEARGAWTAIARAPWLHALTLYAKGDCWHGGGLFTGDRSYWLNDGYGQELLRDSSEIQRDLKYQVQGGYGGECLSLYYPRLLRDGWQFVNNQKIAAYNRIDIFEKTINSHWLLRKLAHAEIYHLPGKGCYWDEHELEYLPSGKLYKFPDWEWAEWDETRLVWATGGCLYGAYLQKDRLGDHQLLYDFNDLQFEPRIAPY